MKKETIEYSCDVCSDAAPYKEEKIQVIFTTEQTEGRGVDHYLSIEKIDLCNACMQKVLKGSYIFGSGAQGHNDYWFKK